MLLDIIKSFIYGIVEGVTEWLPISSTGHLILVEQFLPFKTTSAGFFSVFDVVIQLGAILAVVVLFWNNIWPFAFLPKNREGKTGFASIFKKDIWLLWAKILVSCVPAAIIGVLFDETFERLFYNPTCIAIALIVFGIAFIVIERVNKGKAFKINTVAEIGFDTALLIGIFQVLAAIFPGTSRSGATIIGALLIGVARQAAAEYTFYLAIPVMFGASLLKIVKYLKDGLTFTGTDISVLLVGCVVSFVVSIFILKFLIGYVKKHDFQVFGWYRIALGILVLILGFANVI